VAHHLGPVTGAPLLDGALATLECQTTAVHDAGDHSIIVGQVAAAESPASPASPAGQAGPASPAGQASPAGSPARGPLVHYAGGYRRLRSAPD
jgi:flavin reductase (DIM6/NTAB) family NADH-FMN oxidoreductase RutF